MRDFQNVINNYLLNHEKQKKYLAVVLALSMLVTFIVPLILTQSAESMTRNNTVLSTQLSMTVPEGHEYLKNVAGTDANIVGDVTYSPEDLSEVTLLIGEEVNGSDILAWAEGCTSAEEVIEAAKSEYFLGIANDFCVFLEGDFTPTQADAEGRVAVGGDIQFTGTWNYQIGSGDYAHMEALIQRDKYLNLRNFAHAIVGGAVFRVHTLSTGKGSIYDTLIKSDLDGVEWHTANKGNDYSYTAFYPPELDLYKKLVVGEPEISTHYDSVTKTDVWYNNSCSHDYPGDCCSVEDAAHSYLSSVNELAQMYKGELINFSEVFDWLRNQSQKLSRIENTIEAEVNGTEVIFRAPENSTAEVVYFNLDSWDGITSIKYENIPEIADGNNGYANVIVNCGSEMINIAGSGNKVSVTFNGVPISNNGDSGNTDDERMQANNHELSENILFNFYEATQIDLNANFNGTILAPDAKVVSVEDECKGHLSGALIAQSFRGGMEFGYRPYRGPSEILGTDSGYTISLDKFAPNSNYLSGATFEITDNFGEIVQSWVTSGKRDYITLPTRIDFSGNTDYAADNAVLSHSSTYTIKETRAPEGFIKDDATSYTVEITETVNNEFLFINSTSASGGTFPRDVKTVVTLKKGTETLHTWTIEIFDIYEKAGLSSRRLTITEDGDAPQMFYLNNTDEDFTTIDLAAYVTSTDDASTSMSSYTYKDTSTFETSTEIETETIISSVVTSGKNTVVNKTDENGSILTEPGVVVTEEVTIVHTETEPPVGEDGSTSSAATTRTETTYVTVTDENQNPVTEPNVTCTTEITTYWTVTELSTSYVPATSVNAEGQPVDGNGSTVAEGESAATYMSETNVTVAVTGTSVSMVPAVSYYIDSVLSDYNTECVIYPTATIPDFDTSTEKVQPPVFTLGEGENQEKYYYDKISNMIMPLPDEDKTPKFVNSYGLIFRKVDQKGKDLLGADIKLTLSTANDNLEIWSWNPETDNEKLIDLSDLTDGTVYVFREETPPVGYEDAPDIYFKVDTTNAKVYYGASADSLTNEIDLTTEHVLEMTDVAMHGAKVTLTKIGTNATDGVYPKLANAEFKLFTSDGILVYPIGTESGTFVTGEDGTIDLYETFKAAGPGICNPTYIKEGYLLEGSYYLQEVNAPTLYETPTEFFYFNVEKADEGGFEITTGKTGYTITNNGTSLRVTSDTLNSITEEMITSDKSFIKVTLYTSDASHVKDRYGNAQFAGVANGVAYEQNQNSYMPSGITNNSYSQYQWFHIEGEYMTFTLKLSDVCKIMGVDQTLEGFKKITEFGINTQGSTVVHEVELFPVYVPETYTITEIIWGDPCSTLVVDELTFYYLNGTTKTAPTPVTWTDSNDYWHPFVIDDSMTKEGVVGVKLKVSGSGNSRIFIKAGDNIFGTGDSTRCSSSDEPYCYGDTSGTDYTNLPEEETPSTSTTPTFSASGSDITVPNDLLGQEVDLRVLKKWSGDTGFEDMRPANIQIQLYQATEPGLTQDQLTDAMKYGEPVTVTGSSWQYMWKDLPRIIPDDDQSNGTDTEGTDTETVADGEETEETTEPRTYYYYVKEVSGNSEESYIVSYDNNGTNNGGTIGVTNSLISIDVEAVKKWVSYGETIPQSIKLQLQWSKNDDGNFVDVEGREVEITSADQWSYEFTNLPSGAAYRVREVAVPAGWTASDDGFSNSTDEDGGKLNITNTLDSGSIKFRKIWKGDSEENRPQTVQLQLYRAKVIDPKSDYARLLQYSLYFYDANMCGTQAEENSLISWRSNCHISDATNGVDGGYHDAGDHVMFGLPQGYTASTLGWSYYEFSDAYDELGQTEHYKTIMEHFCDFFVASTELNQDGSINRLLWQKGNGDQDHVYWGRPEDQNDGSRDANDMYWINSSDNHGGDIAAEYAASLALAYLNFYDPDMPAEEKAKYENYLAIAKKLYAFAQSHTDPAVISFYQSSGTADDRAMAAGWLYLATVKEGTPVEEYKTFNAANSDPSNAQAYSWDSVILGAAAAKAHITGDWSAVSGKVKGFIKSEYWYPSWGSWGTARYNAAMQFVALAAAKNDPANAAVLRNWAKGQMNYILGDNDWGTNGESVCLVTGFASNSGQWAHHRGASGYDTFTDYEAADEYAEDGHVLVGALLGGPAFTGHTGQEAQMSDRPELLADHKYIDSIRDYCCNEVALDYNAGLVGAAIGLYDAFGTGELRSSIDTVEKVFAKKTTSTLNVSSLSAANLASSRLSKAAGIKGISVVESDKVANASSTTYKLDGTEMTVTTGNDGYGSYYGFKGFSVPKDGKETHRYADMYIENVNRIRVIISSSSDWGGSGFKYNDSEGTDWLQGNAITEYLSNIEIGTPTSITSIQFTDTQPWNETLVIDEIRLYTKSSAPVFTISADKNALNIGETTTLRYENAAENATVNYTQSGDGQVSIEGSTITALKPGTVQITGTDGTSTSKPITIEVSAMGIQIEEKDYTAGDTITVNITNKPVSGTVEYSTDNATWTAVADGASSFNVTAPDAASVTIYVKHADSESEVSQNVPITAVGITGTLDMIAGQQTTLTVNKTGTYTWTSDTPAVATVDDSGNVTALTAGEAVITATGDITVSATVNVTAFQITNRPASAMTVGNTLTLTHNSTGEFTWTSSNESVLIVDQSGNVTAVGEGSADITATDKDTQSVSASVTITSKYGALQVTPTEVTLHTGDSAALTPIPADNVSYEVSDPTIVEMDGSTITALNEGTATITAKRTNSDGQEETVQINVTVVPALTITAPNGEDPAVLDIGGTVQLTANNVQGTANWSIPSEYAHILSVDQTGLVTALSDGVAIVQVTDDTNGTPAAYNVKVSLSAAKVTLPDNAAEYKLIELTADESWQEVAADLPKTDGNGTEYVYYVAEVTDNGDGLNGQGGAIYYPISYSANGITLGDTEQTIDVTNKKSEEVASGAQMPSAGGEGTTWYYIAGAAMMLAGIAGYFVLKRKQTSER